MKIINQVVQELKKGKVIICPTDTVYGLIADATNKKAVEKIFKIKKRPKSKSLPIFVKDFKMAKKLAEIDKNQEKFLKKAWPGKTTAVLKLKIENSLKIENCKLKIYGIGKNTVALRIPDYKLINALLKKLNHPLAETSANISGRPPSVNIKEVLEQFTLRRAEGQPDFIIDVGDLPKNKPSKVIDLTQSPPKVLRN